MFMRTHQRERERDTYSYTDTVVVSFSSVSEPGGVKVTETEVMAPGV